MDHLQGCTLKDATGVTMMNVHQSCMIIGTYLIMVIFVLNRWYCYVYFNAALPFRTGCNILV